jgi:hypothetical protein
LRNDGRQYPAAFNGTNVQGHARGNSIFGGGHNFSDGLIPLREQYLVSGLNLFNQVSVVIKCFKDISAFNFPDFSGLCQ